MELKRLQHVLKQKYGPVINIVDLTVIGEGVLRLDIETPAGTGFKDVHNLIVRMTEVPRGTNYQIFDCIHSAFDPK